MKNFFKLILLLLFVSFSIQSFSQVKFKVGAKAGLNIASIRQNFSGDFDDYELDNPLPRLLYQVGPCLDISFNDMLSLQPALLLSAKGVGVDVEKEYDADGWLRWTVNYLELPINVAFKMKGFQVYAGPYIAVAIGGKVKWDIEDESDSETLKFKNEVNIDDLDGPEDFFYYHFRPLDYGLNIGAGYKLGPLLFGAGYSLGLANLTPDLTGEGELEFDFDSKDAKRATSTFSISVSYFFGKWKE